MLDPKIIRDDPDLIKQMLKDRAVEFDFEKMLDLNKSRKEMMIQSDELKQKRNQMSVKIGSEKKQEMMHQTYRKRWEKYQRS